MKRHGRIEKTPRGPRAALMAVCVDSCQRVRDQVTRVRVALFGEWKALLVTNERVLRLALNEAEALAWQTGLPHLVFPALAEEKVRAVAKWSVRQRALDSGLLSVLDPQSAGRLGPAESN